MFVADLSERLASSFDVTVLAPASRGAKGVEQSGNLSIRRYRYGWPASSQRLADGAILPNLKRNKALFGLVPTLVLAQLWAAWRLARSGAFDALHAHWAVPQGWVASVLRTRLDVRVLTTAHGGDLYALRNGLPLKAKRWALRSSDRVTAVSSSLRQEVLALGVEEERVRVLPMGVDASRFTPEAMSPDVRRELNADGPALLFAGRLVEKKGARYAIEAMPEILRAEPAARLTIVGDGPERPALEQRSAELGLNGHVRFAGAIANERLPGYFSSADVFIGPSVVEANGDTESFGVVFAEAMASGCPVVATEVGGIGDLVVKDETGLLVPERDAGAIADGVLRILKDPVERERLARNGVQLVRERFDLSRAAAGYAELMEEMLAA